MKSFVIRNFYFLKNMDLISSKDTEKKTNFAIDSKLYSVYIMLKNKNVVAKLLVNFFFNLWTKRIIIPYVDCRVNRYSNIDLSNYKNLCLVNYHAPSICKIDIHIFAIFVNNVIYIYMSHLNLILTYL